MAIGVPYEFDKMEKGDLSGSIPPDNQDPTPDPIPIPEPEPTVEPTPQNNPELTLPAPEPIPELVPEKTSTPEPTPTPDFSDSSVLAYLNKKKGTSFKTLEEYNNSLVKEIEKEVQVAVQPKYDEETQQFLNFKKDTGRGMQDWIRLNENHDTKSDLQLAFDKIKNDNKGIDLSTEEVHILVAQELGVDTSDLNDLEHKDQLQLKVIANTFKNQLKAEQQKYLTPLASFSQNQDPQQDQPSGDSITVNGQEVPKEHYNKLRAEYLQSRNHAVSELEKAEFQFVTNGASGKQTHTFKYDYTNDDKQSMLSLSEDVNSFLPRYVQDGKFNHTQFNSDLWWSIPGNREKAIKSLLSQARSGGVDEVLKEERNIDFTTNPKPVAKKADDGYGTVGTPQKNGMSVKFPFNV